MNTPEELNFVREVAESTGVVLDPVYRYVVIITLVELTAGAHTEKNVMALALAVYMFM